MDSEDRPGGPGLIGLDWGTTRLRAYLLRADGALDDRRDGGPGIMSVPEEGFADALAAFVGDWLDSCPDAPIVASGMVGSRQGWVEVPYLACPARFHEVAAGMQAPVRAAGRPVHLVPGLSCVDEAGVPDVMRGEETQILGALADAADPGVVLLPGTHSKWVWVRDRCIQRFYTFMTGEVFGLLVQHGILGRLMDGGAWQRDAFILGIRQIQDTTAPGAGLLRRLFSARTLPLFHKLAETDVHAYLSGLLIGAEIQEALDSLGEAQRPDEVLLVGGDELVERYAVALSESGLRSVRADVHCVARGHGRLAREAGLW